MSAWVHVWVWRCLHLAVCWGSRKPARLQGVLCIHSQGHLLWGFINYRQRAHSGTAKPVAESSWRSQPEKQCLPSSGTAGEVSQYRPAGTMLGRSLTCLGQSRLRWAHPPFCKPHFSCWVYTNKTHNFLMGELGMCSKIANCLQSLQKTHGEFTKMLLRSVVQMCTQLCESYKPLK